jgi:integrase
MSWLEKRGKYWYIRYRESGKKKLRNTLCKDRNAALPLLKKFNAEQQLHLHGPHLIPVPDRTLTFTAAFRTFKNVKQLSSSSLRLYNYAASEWIAANADYPLYRYGTPHYHNLLNRFAAKHLSQNTRAILCRHLSALFNWLKKNKMITDNPITLLAAEKKQVQPIPLSDINTILDHLNPDQRMLIQFLLYTGLRVGEAVTLKKSDINLDDNIIHIRNHKAKRDETIPIISPVRDLLKTNNDQRSTSNHLFKFHTYNAVRLFWTRKLQPLKLNYTLHQLRKSCGTILANSGIDPIKLQRYLRHSNIAITLQYYVKVDMNRMANEIDNKVVWK